MALIHCNFHSNVLGMASSMDVVLPEQTENQIGLESHARDAEPPCLFLLHGLSDDQTIWQRRTAIERYAAPLGIAVVMPNVHRSYYTNMAHGYRYWDFISEEVPARAQALFRIATAREKTFVAGLSMGGYGAFKLALRCPDRFAAAASLSGVMDIEAHCAQDFNNDARLIFGDGDGPGGTRDDLFALADAAVADDAPTPRLFQWCGTEDFLYKGNLRFRDHAYEVGLPLTYTEGPGGHDWACWDAQIQEVLKWLQEET